MITKTLSQEALQVIEDYKSLPELGIPCPYFIHKNMARGISIRELVGKGTPGEITDQVKESAIRNTFYLEDKSAEDIRQFMQDQGLGIDCSGLAYHVLDSECYFKNNSSISSFLNFGVIRNLFASMLVKNLRPAQNTSVAVFHDNSNSSEIDISKVVPGDIFTLLGNNNSSDQDHVMLIHQVNYDDDGMPIKIHYTHSRMPDGVRQGTLDCRHPMSDIFEQEWSDIDDLVRAKGAHTITLRHPIWLK